MLSVLIIAVILIVGYYLFSKSSGKLTKLSQDFLLRISLSFAVAGIGSYVLDSFTTWKFFKVLTSIFAIGAVSVVVIDIILHLLNVSSSDS